MEKSKLSLPDQLIAGYKCKNIQPVGKCIWHFALGY